jgi:hypothetical protein
MRLMQSNEVEELRKKNAQLVEAILKVPEFIPYPWDWKQCLFCDGKREHDRNCIRDILQKEAEAVEDA